MATRLSTGARNAMLGEVGLKAALADGKIIGFSGSQPSAADNAEQGTKLIEFTLDAGAWTAGSATNGLEFAAAAAGVLAKASGEIWRGLGVAAGTLGWGRFVGNVSDAGGSSSTLVRVDFTIGVAGSGADVIVSSVNVTVGKSITVDSFTVTLPT